MGEMEGSGIGVEGVGQIALTVRDLERSKRFLGEALGLRHLFDAGHMAFFDCGGVRLMLSTETTSEASESTLLYFRVRDIQGARGALEASGVEIFEEPHMVAKMPDHELWIMFVKDEDGHLFGLMSEVRGS